MSTPRQDPGGNACCAVPANDWARGFGFLLLWGLPALLLIVSATLGDPYRLIAWPALLTWMGVACVVNARRSTRLHCYLTGPYFLVLAVLATLHGTGVLDLGVRGWDGISVALVAGAIVLGCLPEWIFGRYVASTRDPRE